MEESALSLSEPTTVREKSQFDLSSSKFFVYTIYEGWARVFVDSEVHESLSLSTSFYVAAFDRQPPWLSSPLSSFSTHVRLVSRLELVRRAIVR